MLMMKHLKYLLRQCWIAADLILQCRKGETPVVIWTTGDPDELSFEDALRTGKLQLFPHGKSEVQDYARKIYYDQQCRKCGAWNGPTSQPEIREPWPANNYGTIMVQPPMQVVVPEGKNPNQWVGKQLLTKE